MNTIINNNLNKNEIEIVTLFGSDEAGFENDLEKQNFKFKFPEGLVCSNKNKILIFKKNLRIFSF